LGLYNELPPTQVRFAVLQELTVKELWLSYQAIDVSIALLALYTNILISRIGFDINSRPQAGQHISSINTFESGILTTENARVLKIDLLQFGLKQ